MEWVQIKSPLRKVRGLPGYEEKFAALEGKKVIAYLSTEAAEEGCRAEGVLKRAVQ